jgi:hypothetical protein
VDNFKDKPQFCILRLQIRSSLSNNKLKYTQMVKILTTLLQLTISQNSPHTILILSVCNNFPSLSLQLNKNSSNTTLLISTKVSAAFLQINNSKTPLVKSQVLPTSYQISNNKTYRVQYLLRNPTRRQPSLSIRQNHKQLKITIKWSKKNHSSKHSHWLKRARKIKGCTMNR